MTVYRIVYSTPSQVLLCNKLAVLKFGTKKKVVAMRKLDTKMSNGTMGSYILVIILMLVFNRSLQCKVI